jgi:hypothetical protein
VTAPFAQHVTFLYTSDLAGTARFYESVLRLPLVLDQGSCRIYRISADGSLFRSYAFVRTRRPYTQRLNFHA